MEEYVLIRKGNKKFIINKIIEISVYSNTCKLLHSTPSRHVLMPKKIAKNNKNTAQIIFIIVDKKNITNFVGIMHYTPL